MKIDRETQEVLRKGEQMTNFVSGDGWREAKHMLTQRIADITDVRTIEEPDPIKAFQEMAARQIAVNIILDWMAELEGVRDTHKYNKEMQLEVRHEYISNIEGEEYSI